METFCVSEQRKSELRAQLVAKKEDCSRDVSPSPRLGESADLAEKLPGRSVSWRRRIPLQGESLAYVLADEAEEAKREVRVWQRRVMSGKRDFWLSPRTSEIVYGNPEGEEEAGSGGGDDNDESSEGKSDFRRPVETSPRKEPRSEDDSATSPVRRRRAAEQLHLEKCAQEGDVPSTYTFVHSGNATVTTPTTTSTRRK